MVKLVILIAVLGYLYNLQSTCLTINQTQFRGIKFLKLSIPVFVLSLFKSHWQRGKCCPFLWDHIFSFFLFFFPLFLSRGKKKDKINRQCTWNQLYFVFPLLTLIQLPKQKQKITRCHETNFLYLKPEKKKPIFCWFWFQFGNKWQ